MTDKLLPLPLTMMVDGVAVSLADCPPGPFLFNTMLGFKTEYGSFAGKDAGDGKVEWEVTSKPDAYCMDSGEFFWGGTASKDARAELMVHPVELAFAVPETETHATGEPTGYLVKRYDLDGVLLDTELSFTKPVIRSTSRTEFVPLFASPAPQEHARGSFEAVAETTENDNFHTSVYERDYDGLLIARCNQNGRYPEHVTAILNGLDGKRQALDLLSAAVKDRDAARANAQYLLDILDNHGFMERDLGDEDAAEVASIRAALAATSEGQP